MSNLLLYAVNDGDEFESSPQPLPVAAGASSFDDLYSGLKLGVYTSFRTFEHNKFLNLAHHFARTVHSMRLLGWTYSWHEGQLRQALHTVCTNAPFDEMRVRIDVLSEPANLLGTDSRLLICLMPFTPPPAELYQSGVKVGFATGLMRANPLVKTADFTQTRKAYTTGPAEVYEWLLMRDGIVLEGTSSNFYGIRNSTVYTANEGVLEGITRTILLDLMDKHNIPVVLSGVRTDEIDLLDEAAISSSSRGLLPVVCIGKTIIGNGSPGPITQHIRDIYEKFVRQEIRCAVE